MTRILKIRELGFRKRDKRGCMRSLIKDNPVILNFEGLIQFYANMVGLNTGYCFFNMKTFEYFLILQ